MKTAFLFPGQGAQLVDMAEALSRLPTGTKYLSLASEVANEDLRARIQLEGAAYLRRNEVLSLVTAAFGLAAYDALISAGFTMNASAGYSVGQWTAMAAAGMIAPPRLMQVIWDRARFMNDAPDAAEGVMLSVIGLNTESVEAACRDASLPGRSAAISNYNCPGQVTIAGHRQAVELARQHLATMKPRRLTYVDVSGAWHCSMMSPAATSFAEYLRGISLDEANIPIIDNVSGRLLPGQEAPLLTSLAQHVDHPVRWEQGMRLLLSTGVERFVEVGFGNMLTKFGFFIDRSRENITFDGLLARTLSSEIH